MAEPIVSFSHVSMQFPDVLANDDVSLDIYPGEVFALIGENGAGKSTLMNILFGMHKPSGGTVTVRGKQMRSFSTHESIDMGIGMVHQHFMLVPSFTVTQNIVLGCEPRHGVAYSFSSARKTVQDLVALYGLQVDPDARVEDLGVGLQQRVEILKTLHRGAEILILDEPTAVLTPQETDELFTVIRRIVREKAMTVIIITHKLYEVMAISDRVGVMRQGKLVDTCRTSDVDERILASMMVGKDVLMEPFEHLPYPDPAPAVTVEDLHVRDSRGLMAVRGVSFTIHRGEILGVAGIEGNGQRELVEALTGMVKPVRGRIRVLDSDSTRSSPKKIRARGLSSVPEDRMTTGVSLDATITENLVAGKDRKKPFSFLHFHLRKRQMKRYAKQVFDKFDIRAAGVGTRVGTLSGGNMQKVVVAREFSFDTPVLIISQPTRGIDVGATDFIHRQMMDKRAEGCAILLVSADLDELYRLSDRMITIYEGRLTGEFDPASTPKSVIGRAMTAVEPSPAPAAAAGTSDSNSVHEEMPSDEG